MDETTDAPLLEASADEYASYRPRTTGVPRAIKNFWATLRAQAVVLKSDQETRPAELPRLIPRYQADAEAAYEAARAVCARGDWADGTALLPGLAEEMANHRGRLAAAYLLAPMMLEHSAAVAAVRAVGEQSSDAVAAAARGESPPASPVNMAEPLPDGPLGNLGFRWHGRECPAMPKPAYLLVAHLWQCVDRSCDYDDACDAVHPDGSDGKEPLANARKAANRYFLDHDIDLRLTFSRRAGRVAIVPIQLATGTK